MALSWSEERNTSLNRTIVNCCAFVLKVLPLENFHYYVSVDSVSLSLTFFLSFLQTVTGAQGVLNIRASCDVTRGDVNPLFSS